MDIIESVLIEDLCSISHSQHRKVLEQSFDVGGVVTVTVNKGRPDERVTQKDITNLLTTVGRDFFHAQIYTNVAVGTQGGNEMAISDDATAVTDVDTLLTGEITTNGLIRSVATTISHITASNETTLEIIYTAGAAFTALHKAALFNASTVGTMTHAAVFSTDVTLAIDDTVTVTWTLTAG